MSKMRKIDRCGGCLDFDVVYREGSKEPYCMELHGMGKDCDVSKPEEILPNCPLEDYPEPQKELTPCPKCKKPRGENEDGLWICPCPHCGCNDDGIPF